MADGQSLTAEAAELLEVFDASGRPTGRAKTRGAIHRDGDWHLAFFCWVARRCRRGPELLLQHRSLAKTTFPGRFDASSAGHVRFGESMDEAARELKEELGLDVGLAALFPFGHHRQEHHHANGIIDREHQALHLLAPGPPDPRYRPDPTEVLGLAWAPAEGLIALVGGTIDTLETRYRASDEPSEAIRPFTLRRSDLVPYPVGYYQALLQRVHERL